MCSSSVAAAAAAATLPFTGPAETRKSQAARKRRLDPAADTFHDSGRAAITGWVIYSAWVDDLDTTCHVLSTVVVVDIAVVAVSVSQTRFIQHHKYLLLCLRWRRRCHVVTTNALFFFFFFLFFFFFFPLSHRNPKFALTLPI